MWEKSVESSFHLTIVACVGKYIHVFHYIFIFTQERIIREVMDDFCIKVSIVNFTPKGFVNLNIFFQGIKKINDIMPSYTKIPFMLIFDIFASHQNDDTIKIIFK